VIYAQQNLIPDRLQKIGFVRPPLMWRGIARHHHAGLGLLLAIHQGDAQYSFKS
jgi:hypothetical protein